MDRKQEKNRGNAMDQETPKYRENPKIPQNQETNQNEGEEGEKPTTLSGRVTRTDDQALTGCTLQKEEQTQIHRAYRTYRRAAAFLAKEDLGQAFRLEQIILSKFEQIKALSLLAGKATAAAEAKRISGPAEHSPLEKAVIPMVILEEEIEGDIARLLEQKRRIARLVGSVQHPEHRLLLELRYLNFLSWEQIAERMNYSSRQILRLHGKALAQLDEGGYEQREGLSLVAYQTRPRNLPRRVVGEEQ